MTVPDNQKYNQVQLEDGSYYQYTEDMIVRVWYTNYNGESGWRTIIPLFHKSGFYGTPHHKEPQYILQVWDLDRNAQRSYAMKCITTWFVPKKES